MVCLFTINFKRNYPFWVKRRLCKKQIFEIIRLNKYIQHARALIQSFLNKFITIICNIAQLLLFLTYVLCFILHLPYPGLLTLLPCFIYLFTLISDAPFLKWHCISHVARHLAQYTSQNGFTHILVISFWLQYIFLYFSDLQCLDMFEFPFKVLPHLSQVHSCFDSLLQLT